MKFTLSWLKDFLETDATLNEICNCLTDIGLEVEEIEETGKELAPFRAALVKNCEKHPEAEKLSICEVETKDETLSIICGAPNVRTGLKTILAPIGSIIPTNGLKIKKSKIRGITSNGMLCSEQELGLGNDSAGIIELADEVEIGTKLVDILNLNDPVIEIAITPNRGDCLGVYGIARELAGAGLGKLKSLKEFKLEQDFTSSIKITKTEAEFKQFNLYEVRDIKNNNSPDWLLNRLKAISINTHNAIVDITNYICFSFGQPLHAYATDKISGNFQLRKAKNREDFLSLDNTKYSLETNDLVIADDDKIVALAGIMGSSNSQTEQNTKSIYLEAAEFDHIAIARTGQKKQIITDSRYRFERQIDASKTEYLHSYSAHLIKEVCGAQISQLIQISKDKNTQREISFPFSNISKIIGVEISQEIVHKILTDLHFTNIKIEADILSVTVPEFRNDITIYQDVIEEITRIYNLNNIPEQEFSKQSFKIKGKENPYMGFNFHLLLCSLGYDEVVNYSFINKNYAKTFTESGELLEVANAISEELKYMRPSLIPSLLLNLTNRLNRTINKTAIFEKGKSYHFKSGEIKENETIALLKYGVRNQKEVNNDSDHFDIFDVKNDIFELVNEAGIDSSKLSYKTDNLPKYAHPGRASELYFANKLIGIFGEIEPRLARTTSSKHRINFAELYLDNLPFIKKKRNKSFNPSQLQKLTRDFSFIFAQHIQADDVKKEILKLTKPLCTEVFIFDEYKIDAETKSLAFNLILEPQEKDLNQKELDEFNEKVIKHIIAKFAATMR